MRPVEFDAQLPQNHPEPKGFEESDDSHDSMDAQIPDEKLEEAGGHPRPRCMKIVTKNFSEGLQIKPRFAVSSKKQALHLKNAGSY